jgi:hypothetical protein
MHGEVNAKQQEVAGTSWQTIVQTDVSRVILRFIFNFE